MTALASYLIVASSLFGQTVDVKVQQTCSRKWNLTRERRHSFDCLEARAVQEDSAAPINRSD